MARRSHHILAAESNWKLELRHKSSTGRNTYPPMKDQDSYIKDNLVIATMATTWGSFTSYTTKQY